MNEPDLSLAEDRGNVRAIHGARWPDRCVVCDEPGTVRVRHRGRYNERGVLLLLGIWSLFLDKRDVIEFGLCAQHAAVRRRGAWLLVLGLTLPLLASLVLVVSPTGIGPCCFCVTPLLGPVLMYVGWRRAAPVRVVARSEKHIWTTAGAPFALSLPQAPPWE